MRRLGGKACPYEPVFARQRKARFVKTAQEENRYKEFIAFTALLTSAVALSIDMLLPAFSDLRLDFSLAEDSNLPALTITCLFIGMAIGTPIYGPLADTFGRIRILQIGIFLFAIGAIGSTFAPNFSFLLISRVIWGFGCAAPRSLAQAMVRDRFEGDEMARVMGIIQTVFFAGPVLAPLIGHLLLQIGSWRLTMAFGLATAIAMWIWSFRIPESLTENKKRALTFESLRTGVNAVCRNRTTVGYSFDLNVCSWSVLQFPQQLRADRDSGSQPTWLVCSLFQRNYGGDGCCRSDGEQVSGTNRCSLHGSEGNYCSVCFQLNFSDSCLIDFRSATCNSMDVLNFSTDCFNGSHDANHDHLEPRANGRPCRHSYFHYRFLVSCWWSFTRS